MSFSRLGDDLAINSSNSFLWPILSSPSGSPIIHILDILISSHRFLSLNLFFQSSSLFSKLNNYLWSIFKFTELENMGKCNLLWLIFEKLLWIRQAKGNVPFWFSKETVLTKDVLSQLKFKEIRKVLLMSTSTVRNYTGTFLYTFLFNPDPKPLIQVLTVHILQTIVQRNKQVM